MRVKCQNMDQNPTIKVGFQAIAISFLLGEGHLVRTLANIVFNNAIEKFSGYVLEKVKKQNDEYSCNLDIAPAWAWMYVYLLM